MMIECDFVAKKLRVCDRITVVEPSHCGLKEVDRFVQWFVRIFASSNVRIFIRLFARTSDSFACAALLALFASLICSHTCSLPSRGERSTLQRTWLPWIHWVPFFKVSMRQDKGNLWFILASIPDELFVCPSFWQSILTSLLLYSFCHYNCLFIAVRIWPIHAGMVKPVLTREWHDMIWHGVTIL